MVTTNKVNGNIVDLTLSDEDETSKEDTSFMDCRLQYNKQATGNGKESLRVISVNVLKEALKEVSIFNSNDVLPKSSSVNKLPINLDQVQLLSKAKEDPKLLCPKELRIKLPKIASLNGDVPIKAPNEQLLDVVTKPNVRYGLRTRAPPPTNVTEKKPKTISSSKRTGKDHETPMTLEQSWEWSSTGVARQYDILHNFFPEPGPSHVNYYEHMNLAAYFHPVVVPDVDPVANILPATTSIEVPKRTNGAVKIGPKLKAKACPNTESSSIVINTLLRPPTFDYVLDAMPNYGIQYCYDSSLNTHQENVDDFKSDVVPNKGWLAKRNAHQTIKFKQTKKEPTNVPSVVLQTLLRPPTFDEVLHAMPDFNIPIFSSIEPFYGDIKDATERKEISHSTVLHIPTQTLNDLEDFKSHTVEEQGFVAKRNELFKKIMGTEKLLSNSAIRCNLASSTECSIVPSKIPPTFNDASKWMQNKMPSTNEIDLLADSPIKVPRILPKITTGEEDDEALEIDVDLNMSKLSPTHITHDDNVIDASPTSKVESTKQNGRAYHRDVKRVRRMMSSKSSSPNLFEGSASPDSHNGCVEISSDEVICVDSDDDVVVCPDADTSQLFTSRRRAIEAPKNGNVLVSKC